MSVSLAWHHHGLFVAKTLLGDWTVRYSNSYKELKRTEGFFSWHGNWILILWTNKKLKQNISLENLVFNICSEYHLIPTFDILITFLESFIAENPLKSNEKKHELETILRFLNIHIRRSYNPWWRHRMEAYSALLLYVQGIHRWIPLRKASDAELWCFLWSTPEQTAK